jgi:HSP20 family molecular chaperone IbpA
MTNETQNQATEPHWATPPVDIFENDKEILITADLPGAKKDDVQLSYENGVLKLESQAGARTYKRTFETKVELDADKITADMKQGVLTLRLPKAEKKVRRIAIA